MTKQITEEELFQFFKDNQFSTLTFKEKIELINEETRQHIYRLVLHFNTYESMKYEGKEYSIITDEMNREEYQSNVNLFCRKQTKEKEWKELFQSPNELQNEIVSKEWIKEWNETEQYLIQKVVKDVRRIEDSMIKQQNKHLIPMKRILFLICRVNKNVYYLQELSDLFIPIYKVYCNENEINENDYSKISNCECITYRLGLYVYNIMLKYYLKHENKTFKCCILYEQLLEYYDNELYKYCQENQIDSMLYAYGPLCVLFRRNFSYDKVLLLLDRIYCSEKLSFSILFLISIAKYFRSDIMKFIGDEINFEFPKFFQNMTDNDFSKLLQNAEDLYNDCESSGFLQQIFNEEK